MPPACATASTLLAFGRHATAAMSRMPACVSRSGVASAANDAVRTEATATHAKRTLQLQRLGGVYHDSVLAVYHCVPATSASPQWRREVMMSAPARRLRRGCQVRDAAGVQPHRPGCVSAAMPRLWATEASSRAQPSPPSKPMGAHTRTAEAEAAWSPDSTTGATSAI